MTKTIIARGLGWDRLTGDWTKLVEYEARDRKEAIRWIHFNRDWLRDMQIIERD